jgi:hypothetical protein
MANCLFMKETIENNGFSKKGNFAKKGILAFSKICEKCAFLENLYRQEKNV